MKKKVLLVTLIISLLISSFSSYANVSDQSIDYKYYQVVTTTDVNVRTGPSMKYPVATIFPSRTLVNLINDEDPSGWAELWWNDNVYFIYKDYLTVIEYDPTVTEVIE